MRRNAYVLSGAVLAVVFGCVNIPDTFEARIYIDIRHIQEQAAQALDYVEGKTDQLPEFQTQGSATQPSPFIMAVEFLSPVRAAYAQELKDTSPRAQQILNKMRERFPEVERIKRTGAVGENNRGHLELVKPDLLSTEEQKNEVQRIIAAENEDRRAYYQEIARLNQAENVKVGTIEAVYAKERLDRAKTGELFQLPPAGEAFDAFKNSEKGRLLGDEAVPGAWVVIK